MTYLSPEKYYIHFIFEPNYEYKTLSQFKTVINRILRKYDVREREVYPVEHASFKNEVLDELPRDAPFLITVMPLFGEMFKYKAHAGMMHFMIEPTYFKVEVDSVDLPLRDAEANRFWKKFKKIAQPEYEGNDAKLAILKMEQIVRTVRKMDPELDELRKKLWTYYDNQ